MALSSTMAFLCSMSSYIKDFLNDYNSIPWCLSSFYVIYFLSFFKSLTSRNFLWFRASSTKYLGIAGSFWFPNDWSSFLRRFINSSYDWPPCILLLIIFIFNNSIIKWMENYLPLIISLNGNSSIASLLNFWFATYIKQN